MRVGRRHVSSGACILCAGVLAVLGSSCPRPDSIETIERREAAEPGMRQAGSLLMPTDPALAALPERERAKWAYLLYRHIALFNPTNGLAQYERGLLLKDRLEQPTLAIGAFETYQRLRPESDKARKADALVGGLLPAARREELARVIADFVRSQRIARLEGERAHLVARLDEVTSRMIATQAAFEAATNAIVTAPVQPEPAIGTEPPETQTDELAPSPDLGIPDVPTGDAARLSPHSTEADIRTESEIIAYHTVGEGDSLWKLAERYYGDPDALVLIYTANKDRLRSPNTLPKGMRLAIPARGALPQPREPALRSSIPFLAVEPGSTLAGVAEQVCGFPEAWESIFRANQPLLESRGIVRGDQPLPSGLELVIPDLPALPRDGDGGETQP